MSEKIKIIGAPVDLGQVLRGVDMGSSAVRYAGLAEKLCKLGYKISDFGNIKNPVRASLAKGEKGILEGLCKANTKIYRAAKAAVEEGYKPIFLGGDHSIAIGTIGGITCKKRTGVIWVDAHGDFNTPKTSKSGNIHGMPLAVLLGDGHKELVNLGRKGAKLKPEDVVLIGLRDLDKEEQILIRESGINYFTMRDIDEQQITGVMESALKKLDHIDTVHVSFDADSLDPDIAPGVGTPVKGGLNFREAHLMMEIIADTNKVGSMDIVEINPMLDVYNKTADIAVGLAVSLFGKRII